MYDKLMLLASGSFLLLAFIVATNPNRVNRIANRWLSLFLFFVAILLFGEPAPDAGTMLPPALYLALANIAVFSFAPLLYLSISHFVTPARVVTKKDLRHFILPLLLICLTLSSFLFFTEPQLVEPEQQNSLENIFATIVLVIAPLSLYWFFSYKKLLKHQKNVLLFSSAAETVDLVWLRNFLWGLGIVLIVWVIEIVAHSALTELFSAFVYLASAYYLAYFAIQQKEVFSTQHQENIEIKNLIEENEQVETQKKQIFTEDELEILKEKLSTLMQSEKPYLDSTLSLPKLAKRMQLGTHELSYLINAGFQDHFFGFVNTYRIEESKRMLKSPEYAHLSIIGIAFEAGFNSKTAFNTAFKKVTNLTPTEFQKVENL
jgi:AraC-like DNA-binding protein